MKRTPIAQPIGWASIFVAAAITLGLTLLLHLFGIGIGLTAIEPGDAGSLRGVGIGTGIWALVAPIIAMFVGGLVVGRTAPTLDAWNSAIHATAAWAVAGLVSAVLVASLVASAARGATAAASTLGGMAAAPVAYAGEHVGDVPLFGLDEQDLVARLNDELARRGMPPVDAANLRRAVDDVVQSAVRGGGLAREQVVAIVARDTALSSADAEKLAADLQQRIEDVRAKGGSYAARAGEVALQGLETSGKVLLWIAIAMLAGLGAGIGGALLAVGKERRDHVGRAPSSGEPAA